MKTIAAIVFGTFVLPGLAAPEIVQGASTYRADQYFYAAHAYPEEYNLDPLVSEYSSTSLLLYGGDSGFSFVPKTSRIEANTPFGTAAESVFGIGRPDLARALVSARLDQSFADVPGTFDIVIAESSFTHTEELRFIVGESVVDWNVDFGGRVHYRASAVSSGDSSFAAVYGSVSWSLRRSDATVLARVMSSFQCDSAGVAERLVCDNSSEYIDLFSSYRANAESDPRVMYLVQETNLQAVSIGLVSASADVTGARFDSTETIYTYLGLDNPDVQVFPASGIAYSPLPPPVPEPNSLILLSFGLCSLLLVVRVANHDSTRQNRVLVSS